MNKNREAKFERWRSCKKKSKGENEREVCKICQKAQKLMWPVKCKFFRT